MAKEKSRKKKDSRIVDVPVIKKKGHPFLGFFFVMFLIGCVVVASAFCVFTMYLDSQSPIPNLETYNPNVVTKIYSSDGKLIKTFTPYKFEKVSLNQIPDYLKQALISTEDKSFYTHKGYDLWGLARSVLVNIKSQKVKQGASTITQQLARVLFLTKEKTYDRKIKELIIASQIEKTLTKDQILEMYLNNVYFGSGSYGVAAAAQTYFGKNLSDLTLPECALIAGLPQAPSVYSPYNNLELSTKRRNQVLGRMYKMGNISKSQYKEALNTPVVLAKDGARAGTSNAAPYFIGYVLKELEALGYDEKDITRSGYKITTTLDMKAQQAANDAINAKLKEWKMTGPNQQAALFAFSPINGAIIAYVGGKNYSQSQYDRITQAVRPPGSSFKPIVYAVAVQSGMMPNDIIEDTPITVGKWSPGNYGDKYRGALPLYKALAISSNVAAVRLIKKYGVRSVIQMARNLGITTPIQYDMTISLGSNGVKLYDMTVAYGVFANGGFRVKPYAVERIETTRGKVIYEAPKTKVDKVLDQHSAAILTVMLKRVITEGTGKRADIKRPMAGKTGTTNDYKDAWFVGYTPDIVTGVWVGNDNNVKMGTLTGGTVPAMIWHDMMQVASAKFPNSDFDYIGDEVEIIHSVSDEGFTDITEAPPSNSQEVQGRVDEQTPIEEVKQPEKPAPKALMPWSRLKDKEKEKETETQPSQPQQTPDVQPRDFKSIPINSIIMDNRAKDDNFAPQSGEE
ncbi:penicillin-binding protein 1A [bacterium]|nr:penicillin-binding protein 1A [bacterium]